VTESGKLARPDAAADRASGDAALAAPGELERVRQFVNTRDLELGTEALRTPADLDAVLGVSGSTADDLVRALAFREALRALLLANATGEEPPREALEIIAAAGPLRADTDLRLAGDGVARLLAIVVTARADGTWARLKACPGQDCQWALYDHTRSRTRRWCAGTKCGARTRSRAYRRRQAKN
jgi:predicted RNA-binding Zn ribbon-like protein